MRLQGRVQNLKQIVHTIPFLKRFHGICMSCLEQNCPTPMSECAMFSLTFSRTIWKLDVPTSLTKSAPSFCSVYVIAKGKISSFRPATYANETGKEDLKSDLPGNRLRGGENPLFSKISCSSHSCRKIALP